MPRSKEGASKYKFFFLGDALVRLWLIGSGLWYWVQRGTPVFLFQEVNAGLSVTGLSTVAGV